MDCQDFNVSGCDHDGVTLLTGCKPTLKGDKSADGEYRMVQSPWISWCSMEIDNQDSVKLDVK